LGNMFTGARKTILCEEAEHSLKIYHTLYGNPLCPRIHRCKNSVKFFLTSFERVVIILLIYHMIFSVNISSPMRLF
jgi:hypothetical protein